MTSASCSWRCSPYLGDVLSYYTDRAANEAFLKTATQRRSVLNIAEMLGYVPADPAAASGTITLATVSGGPAVTVPAGTQVSTDYDATQDGPIIFETTTAVTVPASGGTASVGVVQGSSVTNELLGTSDGTIDQVFALFSTPVIHGSVTVQVSTGTGWTSYVGIDHLIDAGPTDYVFTTATDENGVVTVEFGDGVNGVVPPAGASVRASYRTGGGVIGNVKAGMITSVVAAIDGVAIATDSSGTPITSAMTNGADAESTEQIRANAPKAFRTQGRAVTLEDYEDLAVAVSSVSRAAAIANHFSSVTLYIVGPGGTTPTDALKAAVLSYVQARATAGTTVTVTNGVSVPVNITVALNVADQYYTASVSAAVTTALQVLLSPDQVDFGQRIPLAAAYQTIASVPGVNYAVISVLARADGAQSAADVTVRPYEIVTPGTLTISSLTGGIS